MSTVNITENIVVYGSHGELIFEDTTTNKWFTVTEDQALAFIAAMHDINGGDLRVTKPLFLEADPELERLLAEEDEIEHRNRSQLT